MLEMVLAAMLLTQPRRIITVYPSGDTYISLLARATPDTVTICIRKPGGTQTNYSARYQCRYTGHYSTGDLECTIPIFKAPADTRFFYEVATWEPVHGYSNWRQETRVSCVDPPSGKLYGNCPCWAWSVDPAATILCLGD